MLKILALAIVALCLIGAIAGGTFAYFSDTETITGNTFTAGTIDLTVSGGGVVTVDGTLDDMKPSQTGYLLVTLTNAGLNELELWKKIDVTAQETGVTAWPVGAAVATNEPEYKAEGGPGAFIAKNDIDKYIHFDMWIETGVTPYVFDGADVMVIDEAVDGWLITSNSDTTGFVPATKAAPNGVAGYYIYLGKLAPAGVMKITQSFHMDGTVGNWAQGDVLTFTETFFAQQTVGTPQPPVPATELTGEGRANWVP